MRIYTTLLIVCISVVTALIQPTQASVFAIPSFCKFPQLLNYRNFRSNKQSIGIKPVQAIKTKFHSIKSIFSTTTSTVLPLKTAAELTSAHLLPALIRRLSDAFAIFTTIGISLSLRIPQTLLSRMIRPDMVPGVRDRGSSMLTPEVSLCKLIICHHHLCRHCARNQQCVLVMYWGLMKQKQSLKKLLHI